MSDPIALGLLNVTRSMPISTTNPIHRTQGNRTPFVVSEVSIAPITARANSRVAMLGDMGPDAVIKLPMDNKTPDVHQILGYLNSIAEQYAGMPTIREFTVNMIRSNINHDVEGQVMQILNFVKDWVVYVRDPVYNEYVIAPDRMLEHILNNGRAYGDCDDHVLLLNTMLGCVGFPVRAAGVRLMDTDRFDHVISQVFLHGKWCDLDPCSKFVRQPVYKDKLI